MILFVIMLLVISQELVFTVGVAQSVEHQVVALGAAGSSPVANPNYT